MNSPPTDEALSDARCVDLLLLYLLQFLRRIENDRAPMATFIAVHDIVGVVCSAMFATVIGLQHVRSLNDLAKSFRRSLVFTLPFAKFGKMVSNRRGKLDFTLKMFKLGFGFLYHLEPGIQQS